MGAIGAGSSANYGPTTVPSGKSTTLATFVLKGGGSYITLCSANFASSATGARKLAFRTAEAYSNERGRAVSMTACPNGPTMAEVVCFDNIQEDTTMYLVCEQYSGGDLSVSSNIKVKRIV